MTVVAFPNTLVSFKTSMHEVLSSYFDGAVHEISDQLITFPVAKIVFDIQHLASPLGLTIALIGQTTITEDFLKCHNPYATNKHGVEARASIFRTVIIACPIEGGNNTKNKITVDEAWSKLYALFSFYKIFADKNIIAPNIPLIPGDFITRPDIAEVGGDFTCEVRVKFARYNT